MENKDELMEEKIVEIGEYTVRMTLEEDSLEVVVIDALGEDIESIYICDDDSDEDDEGDEIFYDEDDEESDEYDDDNYE